MHILTGIAISSALILFFKTKNKEIKLSKIIICVLLIAYLWEILEFSFETGLFGNTIANWFYGIEFLPNRLIIYPLSLLLGSIIDIKKPRLGVPAGIFAITFFLIHIFIFPDVVYLQRLL
jgi:hypothetical protein